VENTTHPKNPAVIPNESMERSGMNEEESPGHVPGSRGIPYCPPLAGKPAGRSRLRQLPDFKSIFIIPCSIFKTYPVSALTSNPPGNF